MEGFWAQMSSGADLPQTAPADRWDADAHYAQPGAQSGIYARLGAYCAGMQDWDAAYYKLPANEALAMDPHTRVLLDLSQVVLLLQKTHWRFCTWPLASLTDLLPFCRRPWSWLVASWT